MGILSILYKNFDNELIEDFIFHFESMCETLELLILGLEQKELYKQNIDEIFRIAHNLKSASLYLKLEDMNSFCSKIEDILNIARNLNGPADDEFMDWLLIVSDQFALWIEEIKENRELSHSVELKIIKKLVKY